jgi:hypothetical protein
MDDFASWVVRGTLDMDVAAMQALDLQKRAVGRWSGSEDRGTRKSGRERPGRAVPRRTE